MAVHVPIEAVRAGPSVQWNHVDGPLMTWAGNLHWLTWRERLSLFFGVQTEREIATKLWPCLDQIARSSSQEGGAS